MNRTALFLSIVVVGLACGEASEVMDEMIDTPDAGAMEPPGAGGSGMASGGTAGTPNTGGTDGGSPTHPPESTFADYECDRRRVGPFGQGTFTQWYALVNAGSDPTKVWVHAKGRLVRYGPREGYTGDIVPSGASVEIHFQPEEYVNGSAVVPCGAQVTRDADGTMLPGDDSLRFTSFTVEVKP